MQPSVGVRSGVGPSTWGQEAGAVPGTHPTTWPRRGTLTGTAVRAGDQISISGELKDCDGQTVGTFQADDATIEPPAYPGDFRTLFGDRLLVEADDFTYDDWLVAYPLGCPGPDYTVCGN